MNNQNNGKMLSLFVLFLILVVGMVGYIFSSQEKNYDHFISVDDGWDVKVNDQTYENVTLSELSFGLRDKGDTVYLTRRLPDEKIDNPILEIYTIHSAVEVYEEGNLIYSYGMDLMENNRILGYGYQYIDLGEDYEGKQIEIYLYVNEDDAFSNFNVPEIYNSYYMVRDLAMENRLSLSINLFLLIFGVCLLIVSIASAVTMERKFLKLACIAGFSISIAVWSLCNYDLVVLFSYNLQVKAILEFASLYWGPLFFMLYFIDDRMLGTRKIARPLYWIFLVLQLLFTVAVTVLQLFNIAHFPAFLKGEHVLLLGFILYLLILIIDSVAHKKAENRAIIVGIIILLIVGSVDVLRFDIQKYVVFFQGKNFTSALCVGAIIFVASQIIDFCEELGGIITRNAQLDTLSKMAYTDVMTGLANRRKCEELFDKMEEEGKRNYGIITFDLNNLKKKNDTLGHDEGDKYIRTFANVLDQIFSQFALVARVGGDEFMVVFEDVEGFDVNGLIDKANRKIREVNEKENGLELSAAYGYCHCSELMYSSPRSIYREADRRMYDKKASMKKEMGNL